MRFSVLFHRPKKQTQRLVALTLSCVTAFALMVTATTGCGGSGTTSGNDSSGDSPDTSSTTTLMTTVEAVQTTPRPNIKIKSGLVKPVVLNVEPFSLKEWVDTYLKERGLENADISIAYKDLHTGKTFTYRSDLPFMENGLALLPLEMYTYDAAKNGSCDLTTMLECPSTMQVSPDEKDPVVIPGESYQLQQLLQFAVVDRDPRAQKMIYEYWREHPADEVTDINASMTRHFKMDGLDKSKVTADLMIKLLTRLIDNPESNAYYARLTNDMTDAKTDDGVPRFLNHDKVASLFVENEDVCCDVGRVASKEFFVYAILTNGVDDPTQVMADIGQAMDAWCVSGEKDQ